MQFNEAPLPELSERQKIDWLQLYRSENIGPAALRDLINFYGNAAGALQALPEISAQTKSGKKPQLCSRAKAEDEYAKLQQLGYKLVARGEPNFPKALAMISSAPPILCVAGDASLLARPNVCIIGSRNASANGKRYAGILAERLAEAGICVSSGFARGIDTAAHIAAHKQPNGGTIAVFSGGLDVVYPPQNLELFSQLLEGNGAIISEMPLGWQPRAADFPRRNRIVAGMSMATIVVEANPRSGSLITARLANEFGRLIMAVPGSPLDPRSQGTNKLIEEGAEIVSSVERVISLLQPIMDGDMSEQGTLLEDGSDYLLDEEEAPIELSGHPDSENDPKARIINLLSASPTEISELMRSSGLDASSLQYVLLELELGGQIIKSGGFVTRLM